jgi:hypothetical protein
MSAAVSNNTRGNTFLHPNNLLTKAQRIISGDPAVAVPLKDFPPGLEVTLVTKSGRVVRGKVKSREVDRITIEKEGSLSEVVMKDRIETILGRKVKGGTRRHRRAQRKAKATRKNRK